MEDGQDKSLPIAERIRRLEAYNAAWRNLTWSEEHDLTLIGHQVNHISGGAVVTCDGRTVHSYRPPSSLRDVEAQNRKFTFDFNVQYPMIEPSQDLLAVFSQESTLHLRSLSSGKPHPDASRSERPIPVSRLGDQVFGKHVSSASSEFTVHDWQKVGDSRVFSIKNDAWFYLLDGQHILAMSGRYNPRSFTLLVYECSKGVAVEGRIALLALYFPRFKGKIDPLSTFATILLGGGAVGKYKDGYFSSTNDVYVLSIRLGFQRSPESLLSLEFTVLSTAVTKHFPSARARTDRSRPLELSWDEWAPGKVHVAARRTSRLSYLFDRYNYCRAIDYNCAEQESPIIEVLDFHPRRVASAKNAGARVETIQGRIEDSWLASDSRDAFVNTFLCCAVAIFSLPPGMTRQNYDMVLGEDGLFVIPRNPGRGEDRKQILRIHVFVI